MSAVDYWANLYETTRRELSDEIEDLRVDREQWHNLADSTVARLVAICSALGQLCDEAQAPHLTSTDPCELASEHDCHAAGRYLLAAQIRNVLEA